MQTETDCKCWREDTLKDVCELNPYRQEQVGISGRAAEDGYRHFTDKTQTVHIGKRSIRY